MTPAPDLLRGAAEAGQNPTAAEILDAAQTLFLEFGLRRTTMEDVARRSGVTRVTLYRHFADKQALFQAVVLSEVERSARRVEREVALVPGREERLIEYFVLAVDGARKHPLIRRLMDTEPEWLLPYLTVKAEGILSLGRNYAADYLRAEQARGHFAHVDAELLAEVLVRLLQSCLLTKGLLVSEDAEGLRQITRQFLLPLLQGR